MPVLASDATVKLAALRAAIKVKVNAALTEEAAAVAADARSRASWSSRIPAAIAMTLTSTGPAVEVSATVPHAVLNERRRAWRHPLFGNVAYTFEQTPRPSLGPAVDVRRPTVQLHVEQAVRSAIRETGTG